VELEEAFGKILRELRLKAGISQEELAHHAGLHSSSISFFERGLRKPSLYTVFAIAEVLEMAPAVFVQHVHEKKPDLPTVIPRLKRKAKKKPRRSRH